MGLKTTAALLALAAANILSACQSKEQENIQEQKEPQQEEMRTAGVDMEAMSADEVNVIAPTPYLPFKIVRPDTSFIDSSMVMKEILRTYYIKDSALTVIPSYVGDTIKYKDFTQQQKWEFNQAYHKAKYFKFEHQ